MYATTIPDWASPDRGLASCTAGEIEMPVTMMERARFVEMNALLTPHPCPAKKTYWRTTRTIVTTYSPRVDEMRVHFHQGESVSSHFWRHVSDHEWAKSMRRIRPRRMKRVAPGRET